MSYACGTLCNPEAFNKGNKMAAISNGKQHTLPTNCYHTHLKTEAIDGTWDVKSLCSASKVPTRLWGTTKPTKYGGEERPETEAHTWAQGEMWNIDSNIKMWGTHEVNRNGACAAHDIHRHDQIARTVLPPQAAKPGKRQMPPRACVSGVVSPDCCFLEAWGFDLGLRDRQARPTTLFKPPGKGQQFRAPRSFDRDVPRKDQYYRTLCKTASAPGMGVTMPEASMTLRPEDIGGEAGEHGGPEAQDHETAGRTHASRSCPYWDCYAHTTKREAAKLACSIHSPAFREHKDGYTFVDEMELRPGAIYSLKYRLAEKNQPGSGHLAVRTRESNARRVPNGMDTR